MGGEPWNPKQVPYFLERAVKRESWAWCRGKTIDGRSVEEVGLEPAWERRVEIREEEEEGDGDEGEGDEGSCCCCSS